MEIVEAFHPDRLVEIDPMELFGYRYLKMAVSSLSMDSLVLKEGNVFLITDHEGGIPPGASSQLGLFSGDTRFLSRWELKVLGHESQVLSAQANRVFCSQIDMTTTSSEVGKDLYEHNFIHIRRRQLIRDKMTERLRISNYLSQPQKVRLRIFFESDFADIFEVRGMMRAGRGTYYRPVLGSNTVQLWYKGLDGAYRITVIAFDVPPTLLEDRCASYDLVLEPGGSFLLEAGICAIEECPETMTLAFDYHEDYLHMVREYGKWRERCTAYRTDGEFLDSTLAQSITDLRALYVELDGMPIIGAGIPWYSTAFGRDSIITSLETLMVNPDIARDTLLFMARHQGAKIVKETGEEPGRIMHEIRRGEMAKCHEIPHQPYFGTVDATPLFIVLLSEYFAWTGDEELVRSLLSSALLAVEWIDKYADLDHDGFAEYAQKTPGGVVHQGWKDSVDGVCYADRGVPSLPIALVEVQGYVYDAKRRLSRLCRDLKLTHEARRLRAEALKIYQKIAEDFWMRRERFYAAALDGQKNRVDSVTSNPGHLLFSRAVGNSQAQLLADRLASDDMYSGWGIRTLSAKQNAYNPLSYHNGSVWPHDNALIAFGLCNYALKVMADRVFTSLYEACPHFAYHRLPELFCGMARKPNDTPVHFPVACSPQAWASGAFFMMLQGLIGIEPDAVHHRLFVRRPRLPSVISELMVHDMRIGASTLTLKMTRQNDRTSVAVVDRTGEPIQVIMEVD